MHSLFYMIILYLSIDPSLFSIIKHVPLQINVISLQVT